VDGRVVQEKSTTLSKGVISHWLSAFKPAIQDYLESFFSSAVRLQGSWNMPYLSIKEERNQARQSEEYPLKSFQSECEKVSTDSAP